MATRRPSSKIVVCPAAAPWEVAIRGVVSTRVNPIIIERMASPQARPTVRVEEAAETVPSRALPNKELLPARSFDLTRLRLVMGRFT